MLVFSRGVLQNVINELYATKLSHFRNHLITLSGNFSRAGGLQAALEYITVSHAAFKDIQVFI